MAFRHDALHLLREPLGVLAKQSAELQKPAARMCFHLLGWYEAQNRAPSALYHYARVTVLNHPDDVGEAPLDLSYAHVLDLAHGGSPVGIIS